VSGGEGLGDAEEVGAGPEEAGVDGQLVGRRPERAPLFEQLLTEADGPGALPHVRSVMGDHGVERRADGGGHGLQAAGEGLQIVCGGHEWKIPKMHNGGQVRSPAGKRDEKAEGERR